MQVLVAILALTLGGTSEALERLLDQWAIAWSSSDSETLLPLFTDNIVYEDVTLAQSTSERSLFVTSRRQHLGLLQI